MKDLIDRTEAIKALIEYREDSAFETVAADCIDILEALPSAQPQWIPCSERLPDEGQGCLVCDKGHILIDTFVGHGNPYNWKWYIRDYEAWMPLPEPYKEGQDG